MNKNDLIDALAPRLGGRAAAALAVESVVDVVLRRVAAGEAVGITGFGTFEPVDRAPRTGRNPHTGEAVPIPATRTPRFRPGTYFKEVVADPAGLPDTGLAGARVGSGDGDEDGGAPPAPGAPATIRRPQGPRSPRPAVLEEVRAPDAAASDVLPDGVPDPEPARRPARRRAGGAPATVRATERTEPRPAPAVEPARTAATGGRLTLGGEQITRDMITAKKAQLARASSDPQAGTPDAAGTAAETGGGGTGETGSAQAEKATKGNKKDKKDKKDKKGKTGKKRKNTGAKARAGRAEKGEGAAGG